eukprot:gb/GEZN01003193.1/.p1 GENE.gb/GEZN01003193.1/~~gb/GEZN01003193.1/.p1  ORF type:complete len:665 (+),score=84.46 gb/GEZN01003193.1/:94-2088(+)
MTACPLAGRRPCSLLSLVFSYFILCLLCPSQAATESVVSISSMVYSSLRDAKPCVRLFSQYGPVGCGTDATSTTGTVRYADSQALLSAMLASPPSDYEVALVLPQALFNRQNMEGVNKTLKVAGVIVLPFSTAPADGYSTVEQSPQSLYDMHDNKHAWNTPGTGFSDVWFPFPVISLPNVTEAALMKKRGQQNEQAIADKKYPSQAVRFFYHMWGSQNSNSTDCLLNRKCLPLGGYSVWSTFGNETYNGSRPLVFGIAAVDANAFFHDMAYGHDSAASGTVALLVAADALSKLTDLDTLPYQIAIALFTGEQWGYLGSRKFVEDVTSFKCDKNGTSGTLQYCQQPYRPDLTFTNVSLNNVRRILELNQVAIDSSNKVYMHYESGNSNADMAQFAADIQTVASTLNQNGGGYTVSTGSNNNEWGLPPSSSQAFVKERNDMPAIVLTDHAQAYSNKYYQSELDKINNQQVLNLCNVATLTARVLYKSAGGVDNSNNINANCTLLAEMFNCWTNDFACDLFQGFVPNAKYVVKQTGGSTLYSSVYQLQQRKYMRLRTELLYRFLKFPTNNATDPRGKYLATSSYHDAVDPALVFDYTTSMWTWPNLTNFETMLYTESSWSSLGASSYQTQDPVTATWMLIAGAVVTGITVVVTLMGKRYCYRHLKLI